jgi:hypothetical protein
MFSAEKAKGRAPKVGMTSQHSAVSTKAWRRLMRRVAERVDRISATPMNSVNAAAEANTRQSGLATVRSAIAGKVIASASVDNRMPTMNRMGRKSIKKSASVVAGREIRRFGGECPARKATATAPPRKRS